MGEHTGDSTLEIPLWFTLILSFICSVSTTIDGNWGLLVVPLQWVLPRQLLPQLLPHALSPFFSGTGGALAGWYPPQEGGQTMPRFCR